jgi:hypothetical protein
MGFEVEIDVWFVDDKWWLGHDEPTHSTNVEFLKTRRNKKLWCHAKNIEAAYQMNKAGGIHYFFHDEDDITLTSKNYLWTYPGITPLTDKSIAVMPEKTGWSIEDLKSCAGICSDFILRYENE